MVEEGLSSLYVCDASGLYVSCRYIQLKHFDKFYLFDQNQIYDFLLAFINYFVEVVRMKTGSITDKIVIMRNSLLPF